VVLEVGYQSNVALVKFEERATPKLELLMVYLEHVASSRSLLGLQTLSSLKEVALIRGNRKGLEYVRAELALHPNQPVVRRVELYSAL
jgi:hypothetical protein